MAWPFFTPPRAAIGGLLIGCAAALFILGNGRIAGISGIVAAWFLAWACSGLLASGTWRRTVAFWPRAERAARTQQPSDFKLKR